MHDHVAEDLTVLGSTRVLFGHQSVGANLLAGLTTLAEREGIAHFRVVPVDDRDSTSTSWFREIRIGENGYPESKIDHFAAVLRDMPAPRPRLALMKLCYADFTSRTDVDSLVAHYADTLSALKRDFPDITFMHVTVPLTTRWPVRLKEVVYRLLHREERSRASAVKRDEFNRRLRELFPADPLFDLAGAESTSEDGTHVVFRYKGRSVPALEPAYTWDGAHLNALGQEVIASAMARALADAVRHGNTE